MKYRSYFRKIRKRSDPTAANTVKNICFRVIFSFIGMATFNAHAETVYYSLDNVILDDGTQMTGIFSWIYDIDDFENGAGQFTSLDIPWTSHDESDLAATFDIGGSIEITLTNNLHDDGVDITLFLLQSLTPTTSSSVDLARSKYDIGGNGFHAGRFLGGTVSPTNLTLSIAATSPGFASLSWEPEIPGYVLQETPSLSSNWMDSASGGTNPVVVPVTVPTMFYRLAKP